VLLYGPDIKLVASQSLAASLSRMPVAFARYSRHSNFKCCASAVIGLDHGRWIDRRNTKKVVPKPNSMLQGCLYRRCKPRHIESLGLGRLIVKSRSLLIIVVSPQWDIPMHDQTRLPFQPARGSPAACSMRCGRSTTPVAGPIITLLDSPDFVELVHDRTHLHPANYRNVVRPPVDQFGSFEEALSI
jgi:hypothetical protein